MNPETENRLRSIIVDDEIHGRENLKLLIKDYCPEIELLGLANNAIDALTMVKNCKPDVVFLDINMPDLDGFDFLQEYENRDFMVVFVTAYDDYGIKAVKAGAADYLLKPVNIKELKLAVKKLLHIKNKQDKHPAYLEEGKLIIPSAHGFAVVCIDDILRLEADGSYTKIVLKENKSTIVSRTLKDFEDTLPKEKFFRTHKSYLIHLKYIKEYSNIDGGYIVMEDGSKVEISRRKALDFIQKMKEILNVL